MMELKWKNSTAVESDWPGTDTDVASVPGGWIVRSVCVGVSGIPSVMAMVFVPDPPAPHCQPTPPADDRPPMTDDALRAWLTATHGEPKPLGGLLWWDVDPHSARAAHHDPDQRDKFTSWTIVDDQGISTSCPASIAGPALHAAHRRGNP
jgi:hypothetical protein